jgi:hypothetical protein
MKFNLEKSIQILERTPIVVEVLLQGLDDEWIYSNEGRDTWSPFDVVGHYIQGEKTDWIPRMQIILGNGSKKFQVFDRTKMFEDSKGKNLSQLIDEFKSLRKQNLDILRNARLDEKNLSMTGIHPEFGDVTLKQLLSTWVTHDLAHLVQISRVMTKQYKEEIGPWPKYFSVFNTAG